MCGISGFVTPESFSDETILKKMVKALGHRGPDDSGTKIFKTDFGIVGLAQARLSIIDLSNGGHQPMGFDNYEIIFNGEIYNYKEIKVELEALGHIFKTESDTEVILHSFHEWGENCVHRFIGMFAFVIFDKRRSKLFIFRDRVGVKPLYYYKKGKSFLFSSELKSFHEHPVFEKNIDQKAAKLYFDFGYIPAPYSIFQDCKKLEAGNFIIVDLNDQSVKIQKYWDVNEFYEMKKLSISYEEAKDETHKILKSAFNYRMVSDVPVGVFLSGGFDSSAVTAILQSDSMEKLKTFTIGFDEGENEAPFAKETAKFLGTDHTEYYFTTKEAQELIPELPFYFDEPFFDSSSLPTMMVSKLAKKDVTVALSADGGDEIFSGYDSYPQLAQKLEMLNSIPPFLKGGVSSVIGLVSSLIPHQNIALNHKLEGVQKSLHSNHNIQARELFLQTKKLPTKYMKELFDSGASSYDLMVENEYSGFYNEIEVAMAIDFKMYLPDDILTKVDRSTMSVSLEGREPFLDHRIIEFVSRLPTEYKFDGVETKKILKDIVYEYIPKKMMNRPKKGFTIPIYQWLRGDLSYLIDEFLNEESLNQVGVFNTNVVLDLVASFKKEKLHYVTLIWKLLMFQMWYKKWC